MPDSPLPEYVDARKIFIQNSSVSGFLVLEQLERLSTMVAGDTGGIKAEIHFTLDEFGRKRITGSVKAEVTVVCQRCLEPLLIQLTDDINLVLVADEEAAKALDKQFDPWINEGNKIHINSLIDEQLILCVPIVCYHEDGPCSENRGYNTEINKGSNQATKRDSGENPFAILSELKKH